MYPGLFNLRLENLSCQLILMVPALSRQAPLLVSEDEMQS